MTDALPPEGSFRHFLDNFRSAIWMRTELAAGWWQILVALPADEAVDAWTICAQMHLLNSPESPDDILPIVARDRKLPRYPLETADQHRARLHDAWDIYATLGTEAVIETQLRAAGYGPTNLIETWGATTTSDGTAATWGMADTTWSDVGAAVEFRHLERGPRNEDPPYRSQFWVTFNHGFHPVEDDMIPWGEFEWGDSTLGVWSYVGMSDEFLRTALGIVYKWKPSTHVFRGFRFLFGGITTWGEAGHTWGEADNLWGNALDYDVPLGTAIP